MVLPSMYNLQVLQNAFAFGDAQAGIGRSKQVFPFESGDLLFNRVAGSGFSHELHNPFHAVSLRHPTTLHALFDLGLLSADFRTRLEFG